MFLSFQEFLELSEDVNALSQFKDVRQFDFDKSKMTPQQASAAAAQILQNHKDQILKAYKDFLTLMKSYTSSSKLKGTTEFLSGMKPVKSIISKVVDRGKSFKDLGDLIRGALLFDTQDDLNQFVKDFSRKESGIIVKYEEKTKGSDPTYGYYGSHHFDLNIDGFVIELQAMTQRLWKFKEPAHDIYNMTRDNGGLSKADQMLSKRLFSMGNSPGYQKEDIEQMFEAFYYDFCDEILLECVDD